MCNLPQKKFVHHEDESDVGYHAKIWHGQRKKNQRFANCLKETMANIKKKKNKAEAFPYLFVMQKNKPHTQNFQ